MAERRLDATALCDWAHTSVGDLLRHTDEINGLNVFPVADADTGTNMLFTMRAALVEAEPAGHRRCRRGGRGAGAGGVDRGAGQLRGHPVADPVRAGRGDRRGRRGRDIADIDVALLGAALRHAVALVVAAMGGHVVDGTVVSVLQAAAGAVERSADAGAGLADALPPPPTRRPRPWSAPPTSCPCWPRPGWWTPVDWGCWCCWTR